MLNSPKLCFGEDIRRNYSRATFDLALWLYITPKQIRCYLWSTCDPCDQCDPRDPCDQPDPETKFTQKYTMFENKNTQCPKVNILFPLMASNIRKKNWTNIFTEYLGLQSHVVEQILTYIFDTCWLCMYNTNICWIYTKAKFIDMLYREMWR